MCRDASWNVREKPNHGCDLRANTTCLSCTTTGPSLYHSYTIAPPLSQNAFWFDQ